MGETLEELWISHNPIEKLKGIGAMKKLRVLNMSNNNVREWIEFARLAEVLTLKDVVFMGRPNRIKKKKKLPLFISFIYHD